MTEKISEQKNKSVEETFEELEAIVLELENEQTSLEKSVELFERGIKLSNICHMKLVDIEQRIKSVTDDAASGGIVIQDDENLSNNIERE